jgi:hypothetical protein
VLLCELEISYLAYEELNGSLGLGAFFGVVNFWLYEIVQDEWISTFICGYWTINMFI